MAVARKARTAIPVHLDWFANDTQGYCNADGKSHEKADMRASEFLKIPNEVEDARGDGPCRMTT